MLNYLAALSVFIYLSKVHVQYACTNFLLGEREQLSGAWRLTTPAAGKRRWRRRRKNRRGGEEKQIRGLVEKDFLEAVLKVAGLFPPRATTTHGKNINPLLALIGCL